MRFCLLWGGATVFHALEMSGNDAAHDGGVWRLGGSNLGASVLICPNGLRPLHLPTMA